MTQWRLCAIAVVMFSATACGAGEVALVSTTTVTVISTTPETTTTLAPDPYTLDDLADAYTAQAKAETTIFTDNGYGGDLIVSEFSCDALEQTASFDFVICAIGGTVEHPFALVIGDEYVSRERDTATTSLLYLIFQPVPHDDGVRAVKALSGYKTQELGAGGAYPNCRCSDRASRQVRLLRQQLEGLGFPVSHSERLP